MTPVLYILMRTDLPSMNAGKAMAQASHASNAFVHEAETTWKKFMEETERVKAWKAETPQGFGTVLTLAVTGEQLKAVLANASLNLVIAGEVVDPTYPYRVSGEIANIIEPNVPRDNTQQYTLTRREVTCAYLFGDKDGLAGSLVSHLPLHP